MPTCQTLCRGLVLIATLSLALPGLASATDSPIAKDDQPVAASSVEAPLPYLSAAPRSEARPVVPAGWESALQSNPAPMATCHPCECSARCPISCC